MNCKKVILILTLIFITNCTTTIQKNNINIKSIEDQYSNKGFTMIYNEDLFKKKIISKKIDNRSYLIFSKHLKKNSSVKLTNLLNGKSTIAKVKSNSAEFPIFYNSVITERISQDLEISINEPYIEIQLINNETSFIAKKSKTFDEEKNVAEKAPVDGIIINDLNENKTNKKDKKAKDITYSVKIADFYYRKSAEQMLNRIKEETKIKKYKIIKLSETNFRVILGPYNDIKTLEDSYNKATVLNFDNLEILRND